MWPNLNLSNGALRANSGEIVGLMSLQGCNPHLEHPNALRTLLFDQQPCVVLFFRSAGRGSLETVCICIYIYIYTNDTRAGDVAININVQLQEGTPHLEHCCSRSVCATASYSPKGWGISTRLQAYFRKIPRIS